jgi:hypothetical protein
MSEEHERRRKSVTVVAPAAPPEHDSQFTLTIGNKVFSFTTAAGKFQDALMSLTAYLPILLEKLVGEEGHEGPHISITHVASNYSMSVHDRIVLCDATDQAIAVTLPAAVLVPGETVKLIKVDDSANAVSVVPFGGDLIEGADSKSLASQFSKLVIFSDGASGWLITVSS